MAIPTCNVNTDVISNLPDAPALTSAELKAKFDKAVTDLKGYINNTQNPEIEALVQAVKDSILNKTYPVGAIYISTSSTNPATLFGGTWETIKDKFLLSAGDEFTAGDTGGEKEHKLTIQEMPAHRHYFTTTTDGGSSGWAMNGNWNGTGDTPTGYEGGSKAHNNMPPYLAVYMWKRVS